jgi:hypothetical protein
MFVGLYFHVLVGFGSVIGTGVTGSSVGSVSATILDLALA